MNHFRLPWIAMIVAAAVLTGCGSQKTIDNLQTLYRKSQEQIVDLRAQLEECRARLAAIQNAPLAQDPTLMNQISTLTAQRDSLAAMIEQLKKQINDLANSDIVLPPEIDDALKQLAAEHPDVMVYDSAKGMVKLKSDLTFALGSANINDKASGTLKQLASILQAVVSKGYELRIVGHTDNVAIRRADTKAAHPTNWHLSVHRAISVKDVIEKAGVPAVRIGVAGHGEHHPIAPNGAKGNEANRRVEIYIERATYVPTIPEPAATPAVTPAVAPAPEPAAIVAPTVTEPAATVTEPAPETTTVTPSVTSPAVTEPEPFK